MILYYKISHCIERYANHYFSTSRARYLATTNIKVHNESFLDKNHSRNPFRCISPNFRPATNKTLPISPNLGERRKWHTPHKQRQTETRRLLFNINSFIRRRGSTSNMFSTHDARTLSRNARPSKPQTNHHKIPSIAVTNLRWILHGVLR